MPSHSTSTTKPVKPYADFPLFAHNNGQWAKRIRGKLHCFGVWRDPEAAFARYERERHDLNMGRVPRKQNVTDGVTLETLVEKFVASKLAARGAGELSPYTFKAYWDITRELLRSFGPTRRLDDITPDDFATLRNGWVEKWGAERLSAEIRRAKTVFNYAVKSHLVTTPIRYGESFKVPSKKVVRLNRADAGSKMFEADELRRMIAEASQPLRTMLLFAINAGLGNNDLALMPLSAIDAETGWLVYPRPRTGMERRCPLWPETLAALVEWLDVRPTPKCDEVAGLVFLTRRGDGWGTNVNDRPITHACRKLLDKLGIGGSRNIYAIRRTFETIAGDSRDQVAVDSIMGHDDGRMSSRYREWIADDRLIAVTEFVRRWLFEK